MKKLLNVLFVTAPDAFLALDGENVVIKKNDDVALRVPLHNLENIVCFGHSGASPALMGACAERNVGLCFLTPNGRFLARVSGRVKGNVLLRKKQYQVSEITTDSVPIASSFLIGKIFNSRTPATPRLPSPCLGQHTEYVCCEVLGMTGEDFVSYMEEGVFGQI